MGLRARRPRQITLVTALTGINPDRLKEEREREMTIDLGFASLTLPNGEKVGIIDVPGHRDFIGNMLAGIGGIDAVLSLSLPMKVSPRKRGNTLPFWTSCTSPEVWWC